MRFSAQALAAVLAASAPAALAQTCITPGTGFSLDLDGSCNYDTVLASFEQFFADPINRGPGCTKTAAAELKTLLGGGDAEAAVTALCNEAKESGPQTEFYKAADKGTDLNFEQLYFNGGSEWNEQVQTKDENGNDIYVLKEDAYIVGSFYEREAEITQIKWPGSLTNFNLDKCEASAAMCCWVTDRQAQDNNGNCNTPYDVNCVNKDPGDNTDLCYVNHPAGNLSTKFDSTKGFSAFPGDDNNNSDDAEGPIHCHGFAWADDEYDFTARYKANNLFYVSMYDHMYQRGYVRNVPGAPMCACVEQMPVVSRSDCTQIDVVEEYSLQYDGSAFHGSLDKIEIDFNACQGINNRNNDLWAYMGRLYNEGKVTAQQYARLGDTIVENNNCEMATKFNLKAEHNYILGYRHDPATWVKPIGKGGFLSASVEGVWGKEGFKANWNLSGKNILMRKCQDCVLTHQTIFYKRLTPVPADGSAAYPDDLAKKFALSDLLNIISNYYDGGNRILPGHKYGVDFKIYSTLADAEANTNEWACTNYNYKVAFPGDCAPAGGTKNNQHAVMQNWWEGRLHAAWYFPQNAARASVVPSQNIGIPSGAGQTLEKSGTYYMTIIGGEMWNKVDAFHFMSTPMTGDVTVKVRVANLENPSDWSKAGIMIRSSLDPAATYMNVELTGKHDVYMQRRMKNEDWTSSSQCTATGCANNSMRKTAWLMLTKRAASITAYVSADGTTWSQISIPYTIENLGANDSYHVGLCLSSANGNRYAEATFTNYEVEAYYSPTAAPSKVPAPVSTEPSLNVGIAKCSNCSGRVEKQGNKIIMYSKGRDIWSTTDMFTFWKAGVPFTQGVNSGSNFDVTAHLIQWDGPQTWSKTGIMVRDSTLDNAAHFYMMCPEAHNPFPQWRLTNGASSSGGWADVANTFPSDVWLKVEKRGNVLTGFYKLPTGMAWIKMGEKAMNWANAGGTGLQVGLATTSNTWGGAEAKAVYDFYEFKMV